MIFKIAFFALAGVLLWGPTCGYADSGLATGGAAAQVQIHFKIVIPESLALAIETGDPLGKETVTPGAAANASGTLNSHQSMVLTDQSADRPVHTENGSQSMSYPIPHTDFGTPGTLVLAAP
jgi:hypothetical protein